MAEAAKSFDAGVLVDRLARFGDTFPAVVRCFSDADSVWQPEPGSWSMLQIVCHMADEETEDFRARVFSTLEDPAKAWTPIDPQGVAIERDYQGKDLKTELKRFVDARAQSIELLRELGDPDWSRAHEHPKFGVMVASDLLAAWCAHDALHLRQLSRRLFQLANRDGGEGSTTKYAGTW